jgi:myosin heavy subunit
MLSSLDCVLKVGDEVFYSDADALGETGGGPAEHLYEPAKVLNIVAKADTLKVQLADGSHMRMKAHGAARVDPKSNQGPPDILQLDDLSEQSLLHTIRVRYTKKEVYTFVGPILIAINPYEWNKSLYTEDVMVSYHSPAQTLPPHLFVCAETAYANLVQQGATRPCNQSIIISGESGSGKTEATKIIMQFLARVANSEQTGGLGKLEERVLSTNPLLEAFGNAKTLRNDNSSRFGKFIEIQFDVNGHISGARINNYLLEKTRVVAPSLQERNYHIFYQLIAGMSAPGTHLVGQADINKRLQLGAPNDFAYLNGRWADVDPSANCNFFITNSSFASTSVGVSRFQGCPIPRALTPLARACLRSDWPRIGEGA